MASAQLVVGCRVWASATRRGSVASLAACASSCGVSLPLLVPLRVVRVQLPCASTTSVSLIPAMPPDLRMVTVIGTTADGGVPGEGAEVAAGAAGESEGDGEAPGVVHPPASRRIR